MKKTAVATVIGSMVFVLTACGGPSEEFKRVCADNGGKVEKDSLFSNSLTLKGKGRSKGGSSSSSTDYVCVKDGKVLFEED
jgi:hypothetical protein